MASIFTYDPDPPKVSSPWVIPRDSSRQGGNGRLADDPSASNESGLLLSEYGVTKLEAEPQEGPTEYKLHLLLRPRRAYKSMTTIPKAPRASQGLSQDAAPSPSPSPAPSPASLDAHVVSTSPAPSQSRQQRLLQLTTQLLWRLQQSSPYHASSSKEIPLPRLPNEGVDLDPRQQPESLLPGLEESRGALYEIGVSDDGTLVGLTKDEMDESIKTLKIMATSLGCVVEILRMVIVGDAVWDEPGHLAGDAPLAVRDLTRQGKLWVAEAFVTPNLGMSKNPGGDGEDSQQAAGTEARGTPEQITIPSKGSSQTPQLRVTFTGPTMSGKSSLLGTLSTGTLDNGRGKSRLSLLKHRHEVVSGVTSSIAQELIGYKDQAILNFSQGNVESWVDIHDCAEDGRLVFVSDSGGHPRYRRTVLRGLMNWAPHWSILCIAADDGENRTSLSGSTPNTPDVARIAAAGVNLVNAHLTLSLKLNVPLVVVITKLDLASKARLQKTLSKILSAVKDVGRTPKILQPDQKQHDVLQRIPPEDHEKALGLKRLIAESGDLTQYVPIVLTSSVKGTGVGLLHALLEGLPLPPPPTPHDFVGMALNPEQPKCLFHIDDTFSLPASYNGLGAGNGTHDGRGVVASGYLRFGSLAVGDKIVIGPFPPVDEDSRNLTPVDRGSPGSHGLSISHPSSAELARIAMKNAVSASAIPGEWHTAKVVSVRNLRLPVRRLEAGQAGSVGLYFELSEDLESGRFKSDDSISAHVRRGMVIAIPSKHMIDTGLKLQAASGFTATFTDQGLRDLPVGSLVNVYVASVRAAARVRGISRHYGEPYSNTDADDIHDGFSLEGVMENVDNDGNGYDGDREKRNTGETEVVLELLHNREWVELGSRVILLEGGSQYSSGLEGFVGSIVEILD